MKFLGTIACTAALLPLAAADGQFKCRTDLAPPRLNITIPAAKDVEKGYLFIAPFPCQWAEPQFHGPRQEAPYIVRGDGELVWSGYTYFSIWAANLQKARWNGQDVLFSFEGDHNPAYGHCHGHATILNQRYETIRELRAGNQKLMDKHEFHVVDEKTALLQVGQPVPRDLSRWGASAEQQWIVDTIFQELDLDTGELLFEWFSLEHVSPDDYFHINSMDKDAEGNYLISARDACVVHKINGTTGEIIWRLGGLRSDFELGPNVKFCFQHHARFVEQGDDEEIISLFDNSAHGTENHRGKEVHTHPFSQGKVISVNTATWTAEIVSAFQPPDGLLAKSQGSTQLLPNGNALVNWGSEGALTEFRANGTPIFHAYMDSRGSPELSGIPTSSGTEVFVSWNGDTETAVWRFYAVMDVFGSREFLGEATRDGSETSFSLSGHSYQGLAAEAVSASGRVLTTTRVAHIQNTVLSYSTVTGGSEDRGAWRQLILQA
ncbi:hypothetical protein ACN42_g8879 [Penicillium freii]|uniref:ASST-domain-containing protein n=1 Tax=Penicillium freii TaxID=48697 RepID=A0A101MCY5_PENFR|nr:hypothetical protein ACN42_g8879 [Penicillium freii]